MMASSSSSIGLGNNPYSNSDMKKGSQSKSAIAACGGDVEKCLDKLDYLQKITEYDAVSLCALKRYTVNHIVSFYKNQPQAFRESERLAHMMLSLAEAHEHIGDLDHRDQVWRTILHFKIGRKIPSLHLKKAKWERSRQKLGNAIKTLEDALSCPEIVEKGSLEVLLKQYNEERGSGNFQQNSSQNNAAESGNRGQGDDLNLNNDDKGTAYGSRLGMTPKINSIPNTPLTGKMLGGNHSRIGNLTGDRNNLNGGIGSASRVFGSARRAPATGPGAGTAASADRGFSNNNNLPPVSLQFGNNSVQRGSSRDGGMGGNGRDGSQRDGMEPRQNLFGDENQNNQRGLTPGRGATQSLLPNNGNNCSNFGGSGGSSSSSSSAGPGQYEQDRNQNNDRDLHQNMQNQDEQMNNHNNNHTGGSLLMGESCTGNTSLSPIIEEGGRPSSGSENQESITGSVTGNQFQDGRNNFHGQQQQNPNYNERDRDHRVHHNNQQIGGSSSSSSSGYNNNNNQYQNQGQFRDNRDNRNGSNGRQGNYTFGPSSQQQQREQFHPQNQHGGPGGPRGSSEPRSLNRQGSGGNGQGQGYNGPNSSYNSSQQDEFTEPSEAPHTADGMKIIHVNGTQYRKVAVVGRGGSSKVFKVLSPDGTAYALKRVMTANKSQFVIFKNEIELLEKLRGKPNIIQIVDSEAVEFEKLLVLMKFGQSDFAKFLSSEIKLDFSEIRRYWSQMLKAVHVVHEERIVHSDLKPANFLMVEGSLQLIDFGIAKAIPHNDTTNIQRDHQIGTLSYMAPEAIVSQQTGPLKLGRSSDVWSLGIILYQMIYGRTPFAHLNPMQRILAISDPRTVIEFPLCKRLNGEDEQSFSELVDSARACLRREPGERATIPDLLSHPFLVPQMVERLSRSTFQECIVQHLTKTREKLLPKLHSSAAAALAGTGNNSCSDESDANNSQIPAVNPNVSEESIANASKVKSLNKLERQVADSMWKFLAEHSIVDCLEREGLSGIIPASRKALNPIAMERWSQEVVMSANAEKDEGSLFKYEGMSNLLDDLAPVIGGGSGSSSSAIQRTDSVPGASSSASVPSSNVPSSIKNSKLSSGSGGSGPGGAQAAGSSSSSAAASLNVNQDIGLTGNLTGGVNLTGGGPLGMSSLIDDLDPNDPFAPSIEEPPAKRQKLEPVSAAKVGSNAVETGSLLENKGTAAPLSLNLNSTANNALNTSITTGIATPKNTNNTPAASGTSSTAAAGPGTLKQFGTNMANAGSGSKFGSGGMGSGSKHGKFRPAANAGRNPNIPGSNLGQSIGSMSEMMKAKLEERRGGAGR